MSESDEDPRFRIPRGSSDEEIDSDLASGPCSPSPEFENEQVSTLTKPSSSKKSTPSHQLVAKNTNTLTAGLVSSAAQDNKNVSQSDSDDDSEASDSDIELSSSALANVTAAVTKRDLTLDSARQVEPCSANRLPPSTTPAVSSVTSAPLSHPSMISHILQKLRTTESSDGANTTIKDMKPLEKKMNRLHNDKATKLSVPLPEPVSARLERVEAYKQVKEAVTEKWTDTVIQNRRADHLKFPLNEPIQPPRTTEDLVKKVRKDNDVMDHELEIEQILKQAGVEKESKAGKTEEDAINDALANGKVTKEDVLRRQRELAKIRSVVFYYEKKMKRIKKIKSRRYRKELKKDKERLQKDELNSDGESEDGEQAERRRIEERVTQKHKNTSKWVKRQLQRGQAKKDAVTRAAIEDQLRLHEELKKRQLKEVGNESDDSGSDLEDADEMDEEEQIAKLEDEIMGGGGDTENGIVKAKPKKKGIMSLRFMQAAEERKKKDALALLKEMKDDGKDEEEEEGDRNGKAVIGRNAFSGTENSNTTMKKKSVNEEAEVDDYDNINGLDEGRTDDERNEIKVLKNRIQEEYGNGGEEDIRNTGNGGISDFRIAAEAIKDASKTTTSTFTTQLEGRLAANNDNDDNPWLGGFATRTDNGKTNDDNPENQNDLLGSDFTGSKRRKGKKREKSTHALQAGEKTSTKGNNKDQNTDQERTDTELKASTGEKSKRKRKRGTRAADPSIDTPIATRTNERNPKDTDAETTQKSDLDNQSNKKRQRRGRGKKEQVTDLCNLEAKNRKTGPLALLDSTSDKDMNHKVKDDVNNGSSPDVDTKHAVPAHKNGSVSPTNNDHVGEEEAENGDVSQMEEIARAFAGAGGADLAEFEAAKEAEIEKELPTQKKIHSQVLPGWGSWDGAGVNKNAGRKRKESAFVRAARQRLEEARSEAIKSRSDRNMRNVILDQKRHETTTKVTMSSVPYPYQSREEWERELARPLCREFVSNRTMKDSIRGKVDTKLGSAINPIQKPNKQEGVSMKTEETKRKGGKHGVIDLRKAKSKYRSNARRGLMS